MLTSSPPPRITRTRKRTRLDSIDNDHSSDFVFSSDPVDPAIDSDRRNKRIYRGTWWAAGRTEYDRNFDSGVFLASDDSLPSFAADNAPKSVLNATTTSVSRVHLIVNHAIEAGDDVVDLSNLGISKLPEDIPHLLHSLVKPPRFVNGSRSPVEQEYQSLVSNIQLYLANNTIVTLPHTIWSLENLTVLSLRNNDIVSLPSGIARLTQLEELNLANNKLRWLPWELLQLIGGKRLTKLNVRPNPFFTGFDISAFPSKLDMPRTSKVFKSVMADLRDSAGLDRSHGEVDMPSRWLHKLLEGLLQTMEDVDVASLRERGPRCIFDNEGTDFVLRSFPVATSKISYLQADGTSITNTPMRPSRTELHVGNIPADPYGVAEKSMCSSRVPSLLEIAMTHCAAEAEKRDLEQLMSPEAPVPILRAINETYDAIDEGGRVCSSCSRRYIIPRTEWIEFRHCIPKNAATISLDEMFWPFLRRGCSWACVP